MRNDTPIDPGRIDTPEWSEFFRDFGDALATVQDPEPGDPTAFLIVDPIGGRHSILRDRDGKLIVAGPVYRHGDDDDPAPAAVARVAAEHLRASQDNTLAMLDALDALLLPAFA